MLHILAGNAADDVGLILGSAKSGNPVEWIVPKNAHVNDRALFHLPSLGFAARGVVGSEPQPDGPGRYSASVQAVTLLNPAVPLEFVRKNHPKWKWPTYPRSYATIDGAIEKRLNELLDKYQAKFASVGIKKPFPVAKLRAALLAVRPRISEPQMSMLRAHYLYRTLSMERIAFFGGWDNFSAANLHYGKLCGRIANQLGVKDHGKTYTIASGWESDPKGHFQWRMDDEVVKALDELGWFKQVAKEKPKPKSIESSETPEAEREAVIKARVGQGRFRTDVIALWGSCAITGCSLSKVLNASHLVPWSLCETNKEKIDPFNGLLLTPNLDKLVDRCLIAFDDDGSILLSKELSAAKESEILGVNKKTKLRFVRPAMLPYLQRHRQLFHEKRLGGQIVKIQAV